MNDTSCVRQLLHEEARTACVIEVYVGEKNVIDLADVDVLLVQCVNQERHAAVRTGIDKRRTAILNDEVAGVLQRPRILRVDGRDAIV